ncbi:histidine phosphatase family protein [Candidatus Pacearchaeota archaeon]|nr:histidine phosphatase family protein [Candidatus Pacearchaeota archaeon]
MEIVFIRHAEKEGMGEDPFLTGKGIKQANKLAKRLEKEKFHDFYCSDLNRAKQTADIIAKRINIKPKIEKSLNEFESETVKNSKDKWNKQEKTHYDALISFLDKIAKNPNENKSVLIVAHGVTNRIILAYFLNLNLQNMIQFIQKETGINAIYWMDKFKNWRLRMWNDHYHIPIGLR